MADAVEAARRTLNVNVGILGHVDSGKTSLARALSTVGSTASFDKNPQSKERGITLDLGFSSFMSDLPAHLASAEHDRMQITLVDCPGHASLIRTIIGGAQIIDLMLLVVDCVKGVQTQTAECLVIGEILNDALVVVLNKVDALKGDDAALDKMKKRVRKTLSATKFADAPIVTVAARPGGPEAGEDAGGAVGLEELVCVIKEKIAKPRRDPNGPLHFAIDHCFPMRGQGTVLTGTVLSGSIRVGQEIDFPELKQQRKVRSMQMFHTPLQKALQGDRLGVCVTQLDAKALERGIACSPGHVTLVQCCLMAVKPIRFFKAACRTGAKFHVTVGHTTVMGAATFFAKQSAAPAADDDGGGADDDAKAAAALRKLKLAQRALPTVFDAAAEYLYQEALDDDAEEEQWAILQLEQPVACATPCKAICSHFDTDANLNACRLAFHGSLLRSLSPEELKALRIFKHKSKEGQVETYPPPSPHPTPTPAPPTPTPATPPYPFPPTPQVERVHDSQTLICKNLFKPGTDMNLFTNLEVELGERGPRGRIEGTFGKSKFKCVFSDNIPGGLAEAAKGAKLYLRYKRFVFDETKKMVQT